MCNEQWLGRKYRPFPIHLLKHHSPEALLDKGPSVRLSGDLTLSSRSEKGDKEQGCAWIRGPLSGGNGLHCTIQRSIEGLLPVANSTDANDAVRAPGPYRWRNGVKAGRRGPASVPLTNLPPAPPLCILWLLGCCACCPLTLKQSHTCSFHLAPYPSAPYLDVTDALKLGGHPPFSTTALTTEVGLLVSQ